MLKIIVCLTLLCTTQQSFAQSETIQNGQYRILSLQDGLYLNAQPATYYSAEKMDLGELTTEKWANFHEQRWDLLVSRNEPDLKHEQYWILSQDNVMNRLSAYQTIERPKPNVIELIFVEENKYLIRSVIRDACIINPGFRHKIIYAVCDRKARNHQWVFDYLGE